MGEVGRERKEGLVECVAEREAGERGRERREGMVEFAICKSERKEGEGNVCVCERHVEISTKSKVDE